MRNAYETFIGKPEGRACGRPKRRWIDNIRRVLQKWGEKVWAGCMWLKIRSSGEFL